MVGAVVCFLLLLAVVAPDAGAQPPMPYTATKPLPDVQNARYGPYERNVLDLWHAKSSGPAPLLIFFHGGGFVGGDKWNLDPDLLERCLDAGISVATANYRKSTQAVFPAPMLDGARAIQYLRWKAAEYNLDPGRFAAAGNSAGAGIALWVGFHDDLADPDNTNPVLRQSSRLSALTVFGAQCSYDPRFIKEVIGGRAYEHPALPLFYGLTGEQLDTPMAYRLYEEAAPINYVTADDPPVFLYYAESKAPLPPGLNTGPTIHYPQFGQPIEGQPRPGQGIHHPKFGEVLQAKLEPLGIECVLRHQDDYPGEEEPVHGANRDLVEFLKRRFGLR